MQIFEITRLPITELNYAAPKTQPATSTVPNTSYQMPSNMGSGLTPQPTTAPAPAPTATTPAVNPAQQRLAAQPGLGILPRTKAYGQRQAAKVGGFASALGSALTNAPLAALGARTGADLKPDADAGKTAEPIANRMNAAMQQAVPIIKQQAVQQAGMWRKSIDSLLKQSGAANIGGINPVQVREPLMKQIKAIEQQYGLYNYKNLPAEIDPAAFGGTAKIEAQDTVADIDAAIDNILAANQQGNLDTNWYKLVTLLYQASLQKKFAEKDYRSSWYSQSGQGGQSSGGGASANQINPAISQRAQQAGLTARQLGIPPSPANATNNPQVNQVLQSMGFLPQQVPESLSWSRGFDPSRRLLEKIRSQR